MSDCIICFTPLHILIAEKIIKKKSLNQFTLIYFYEVDSKKNRYYFELLAKKASTCLYLKKSNSILDFLAILFELFILRSKTKGFQSVYVGNIKTGYSRFVLLVLRPIEVFTMDDGIGNILVGNQYFQLSAENRLSILFFSLFGSRYLYKKIRNRIIENYTIYQYPNVFNPSVYIQLFDNSLAWAEPGKNHVTVLLTGALSTCGILTKEEEIRLYKLIVEKFGVNMVINHPRQGEDDLVGFQDISEAPEIAEHQIINLLHENRVTVIATFYSTVLLNLPEQVKRINILTGAKGISNDYELFFNGIGIESIFLK